MNAAVLLAAAAGLVIAALVFGPPRTRIGHATTGLVVLAAILASGMTFAGLALGLVFAVVIAFVLDQAGVTR